MKSLQRLPVGSEVTKGMIQIEQLNEKLEQKIAGIENTQSDLSSNEVKTKAELESLLSSKQAHSDIELMENLGEVFMLAWHAYPAKESLKSQPHL